MYLDDLVPAPDSKKIAQIATKIFGYSVDVENISEKKARKLRNNFISRINVLEDKLGSKIANNKKYLEAKIMLEMLDSRLSEIPVTLINQIAEEDAYDKDRYLINADGTKATLDNPPPREHGKASEKAGPNHVWATSAEEALKQFNKKNEEIVKEGALEGAELTLAAKDMVDRLQGMLEDLGEMQNEDLGPLVDAIRDEMGTEIADQFNAAMGAVIGSALEAMRGTRETADGAARILTGEDPAMIGAEEPAMEPTTGMEMPADEMPAGEMPAGEVPDEEDFGAAEAATGGEEELGRAKRI